MINFFDYLFEVNYAVLPHKKLVQLGHREPESSEKKGAYVNLDIAKIKDYSQMSNSEKVNFQSFLNDKIFSYGKIICGKTINGVSQKLQATAEGEVNQELPKKGVLVKINRISGSKCKIHKLPANIYLHEILAVESSKTHFYTTEVVFNTLFKLSSYNTRSEPRNRPTARGKLQFGKVIGKITYGKNEHPLYDKISINPG